MSITHRERFELDRYFFNEQNGHGESVLHLAIRLGHTECIDILKQSPVIDLDVKNRDGYNARKLLNRAQKSVLSGIPDYQASFFASSDSSDSENDSDLPDVPPCQTKEIPRALGMTGLRFGMTRP